VIALAALALLSGAGGAAGLHAAGLGPEVGVHALNPQPLPPFAPQPPDKGTQALNPQPLPPGRAPDPGI
jgi:hypothetical protein